MSDRSWMHRAECRNYPPEMFFPNVSGPGWAQAVRDAQRVCAECPVVFECRQYQQETGSTFGVWGGRMIRHKPTGTSNRLPVCGTESGLRRHQRRGEDCRLCREGSARARAERKARQTA